MSLIKDTIDVPAPVMKSPRWEEAREESSGGQGVRLTRSGYGEETFGSGNIQNPVRAGLAIRLGRQASE